MSLDNLINRMSKSKYTFEGAYFTSDANLVSRGGRLIRLQFEFFNATGCIQIEGGCFHAGNAPPYAFTLEIPFDKVTVNTALAKIRSPELSELEGLVVFTVDGFELIAKSPIGQVCSLHFHYYTDNDFSVNGMLTLGNRSIAFSARETGKWEEFAQAKLLPLRRRV